MELVHQGRTRDAPKATDRVSVESDSGRESNTRKADQRNWINDGVIILLLGLPNKLQYHCKLRCLEPLDPLAASVNILQCVV